MRGPGPLGPRLHGWMVGSRRTPEEHYLPEHSPVRFPSTFIVTDSA